MREGPVSQRDKASKGGEKVRIEKKRENKDIKHISK